MTIKEFVMGPYFKIAVVVLVLVGSFLAGRASNPGKVETVYKDKIVERWREKVVEVAAKSTDIKEDTHSHVEHTEIVKPDGTKETKTVTDTDTGKTTKVAEIKYVDREVQVEKIVEKVVIKTVTPTVSNWTVTVRAGLDSRAFKDLTSIPVILGLGVDRRLWKLPLKAGLWAQTDTKLSTFAGGVALSGDLPF